MKIAFVKSIGFKMVIAMTLGLFAVLSIFSHFSMRSSERGLFSMAETEATKISDVVKYSLEAAMLSGDPGKIRTVMDAFGKKSMVEDIKIMSADGTIKLARNTAEVGMKLDRNGIKSCTLCHSGNAVKRDNVSVVFEGDGGERILRIVSIISNRQACHSCHGAVKNVLGKLQVDLSISNADRVASETRWILIASVIATLLSAILISIFLYTKLVRRPINTLLADMDRVEGEDLEVISISQGNDEIARLNGKFVNMVAVVRESNLKVKEQMNEFRTLFDVGEILNRSDSIDEASNLVLNAISIGFGAEECSIMIINEAGSVQTKSSIGLDDGSAGQLREYLESVFKAGLLQMLETEAGGEGGNPLASVSNRITEGEVFVASGSENSLDDFLVVPLRAAKRLLGVMSIHKIKGKCIRDIETIDAIKRLFMIVAMQVSPYFFIGLSIDEKKTMKISPFSCFLDLVKGHFDKVKEYYGVASLAVIKVENYNDLC